MIEAPGRECTKDLWLAARQTATLGQICLSFQRQCGEGLLSRLGFDVGKLFQYGGSKFLYRHWRTAMSPSTIHDVRRVWKIASIPADGIGPEVISAGIQVLNKLAAVLGAFEFHFHHFDWSSDVYKQTGKYIPENGLESLKQYNAILFGAVGDKGWCSESGLTVYVFDS